jgi:hypothetical protein
VGAGAPAAQQHRRPHPHALAETFKHFIFYDTIRTPACAAQRSRKYIAERRRNACERDKKSKCSSREKETWNRTTSTDSLYSQFPAQRKVKLSSGTGLIQQNASPNVKFTIQGTKPSIRAKGTKPSIRAALPPVLRRLSAPCKGPRISDLCVRITAEIQSSIFVVACCRSAGLDEAAQTARINMKTAFPEKVQSCGRKSREIRSCSHPLGRCRL